MLIFIISFLFLWGVFSECQEGYPNLVKKGGYHQYKLPIQPFEQQVKPIVWYTMLDINSDQLKTDIKTVQDCALKGNLPKVRDPPHFSIIYAAINPQYECKVKCLLNTPEFIKFTMEATKKMCGIEVRPLNKVAVMGKPGITKFVILPFVMDERGEGMLANLRKEVVEELGRKLNTKTINYVVSPYDSKYHLVMYDDEPLLAIPAYAYETTWNPHVSLFNTGDIRAHNPELFSKFKIVDRDMDVDSIIENIGKLCDIKAPDVIICDDTTTRIGTR